MESNDFTKQQITIPGENLWLDRLNYILTVSSDQKLQNRLWAIWSLASHCQPSSRRLQEADIGVGFSRCAADMPM